MFKKTLEETIVNELRLRGMTLTTAESCTGGMIAARIVNVAGASDVFNEGVVTYSNDAKMKYLGVKNETLAKYGAVSAQTAYEMAEGAAINTGSDAAISVTGIAGPGGGTEDKPVGLVYIGCHVNGTTITEKFLFSGNRTRVRKSSCREALKMLLKILIVN